MDETLSRRTDVIIKPAETGDAAALSEIQREARSRLLSSVLPADLIDPDGPQERTAFWRDVLASGPPICLVAVASNATVVGFIKATAPHRWSGPGEWAGRQAAEISHIYVSPDHQRGGIGTRLIKTAGHMMAALGWHQVVVWTYAGNPCARFYEKLGARFLGEREAEIRGHRIGEWLYGWEDIASVTGSADYT